MASQSYLQKRIEHFHAVSHRAMGVSVTFRPGGVPAADITINTINDRRYVQVKGVQSTHPISGAEVSKITAEIGRAPGKGDQLLIDSTLFDIIEYMPDGHGDSKLILHEAE